MAKKFYVGAGIQEENPGLSRGAKKFYFGDENNVSRRVIKGYIGDENNLSRLFYASQRNVTVSFVSATGASTIVNNTEAQVTINGSTYGYNIKDNPVTLTVSDGDIITFRLVSHHTESPSQIYDEGVLLNSSTTTWTTYEYTITKDCNIELYRDVYEYDEWDDDGNSWKEALFYGIAYIYEKLATITITTYIGNNASGGGPDLYIRGTRYYPKLGDTTVQVPPGTPVRVEVSSSPSTPASTIYLNNTQIYSGTAFKVYTRTVTKDMTINLRSYAHSSSATNYDYRSYDSVYITY